LMESGETKYQYQT